jgi:hypothetical protein
MKNSTIKEQMQSKNFKILAAVFLLAACLTGCEKLPTDAVDSKTAAYQLSILVASDSYAYNKADSLYSFSLGISNKENIKSVDFEVYSPTDELIFTGQCSVNNVAAKINSASSATASARFPMSQSYSSGKYRIVIYVTDINGITTKAAIHEFKYDNRTVNYAPVVSDLLMPDTVAAKSAFTFTLKAADKNGLSDIKKVYFTITKPDSTVSTDIAMHDDGDPKFGDATSGDGIYSYSSNFTESVIGQFRVFTFWAEDNSGSVSNLIVHRIYIK